MPFLRTIPHLQVLSPSSFPELCRALRWALEQREGPVAIRYPKGGELEFKEDTFDHPQAVLQEGSDITLVSYGIMINQVLEAHRLLSQAGIQGEVVKLNSLTAFDKEVLIRSLRKTGRLAVVEDCGNKGCVGQEIEALVQEAGISLEYCRLYNCGDDFVPAGKVSQLYERCGITGAQVAHSIQEAMRNV